jgi:hypothetical protein
MRMCARARYGIPGKFPGVSSSSSSSSSADVAGIGGGDPSLEAFCNLTAAFMAKTDLKVVNYIADDDCSPSCTDPMLVQDQVDAVIL